MAEVVPVSQLPTLGRIDLRIDHVLKPRSEPGLAIGCELTQKLAYIGKRDKVSGNYGRVVSVPKWHLVPLPPNANLEPDYQYQVIVLWDFYKVLSDVGQVAGIAEGRPRRNMSQEPWVISGDMARGIFQQSEKEQRSPNGRARLQQAHQPGGLGIDQPLLQGLPRVTCRAWQLAVFDGSTHTVGDMSKLPTKVRPRRGRFKSLFVN